MSIDLVRKFKSEDVLVNTPVSGVFHGYLLNASAHSLARIAHEHYAAQSNGNPMKAVEIHTWNCNLCLEKKYRTRGWLVRHLVSVHRKQMFPKDETLKSAFDIADECRPSGANKENKP